VLHHSRVQDHRRNSESKAGYAAPKVSWRYCARIEPGEYPGYSRSTKIYLDGEFKRWVCTVQFDILDESLTKVIARLTWYLNLGSHQTPHAGRRGAYWAAWVKANGRPPKRQDRLSPRVFRRRFALVSVSDTTKTHRQIAVTPEAAYSVVRDVLRWDTGGSGK
jgi:hypothetical protein